MKVIFPSREFDESVAAVCHGQATYEQMRGLNELLRSDTGARDEYLFRVELHSRLGSEADLHVPASFAATEAAHEVPVPKSKIVPIQKPEANRKRMAWALGLAASLLVLLALGGWFKRPVSRETTSTAVAVLGRVVGAHWSNPSEAPAAGAALEPGWLRLKTGLAQVIFYSGARVVIEGPAELQLISPREAFCKSGLISAEVPPQARGFKVGTPQATAVDLGTVFGVNVTNASAEVHVFKGLVEVQSDSTAKISLHEGEAVAAQGGSLLNVPINATIFARAFGLQQKSEALLRLRYQQWRTAASHLNNDRSLLVHFDFEADSSSEWTLQNVAAHGLSAPDATVVGCQTAEGRWPGKRGLEFRSVSDRVRFNVPGEFQALTLSAWVNVKGLDREFNSLLMCDGFDLGKLHWQIQNSGVLDLGLQGRTAREVQIFTSPPVIGFNQFGRWMHLAVVIDEKSKQLTHYVNGAAVSRHTFALNSPLRIGACELGNWNPGEIPRMPPSMIRHFGGSIDEFSLFNRALSGPEIRTLYTEGKPEPDF